MKPIKIKTIFHSANVVKQEETCIVSYVCLSLLSAVMFFVIFFVQGESNVGILCSLLLICLSYVFFGLLCLGFEFQERSSCFLFTHFPLRMRRVTSDLQFCLCLSSVSPSGTGVYLRSSHPDTWGRPSQWTLGQGLFPALRARIYTKWRQLVVYRRVTGAPSLHCAWRTIFEYVFASWTSPLC
jgi:hypothetical protein